MGKLTCKCLNVQVSVKSIDLNPTEPSVFGISSSDDFFSSTVSEVQLGLEGVKFEHAFLIKTRLTEDWLIHRCMGCKLSTHAVHQQSGSGKVVVNVGLLHESSTIEALRKSTDFSPLYRIVLPASNDNQSFRSLGLQSAKYESLQKPLGDIQKQLNDFLVREESEMEERIKVFMDTQRKAYSELQSKVRRDKNTMVNLVMCSDQQEISESLSDAMTESPTSPLSPEQEISSEEMTASETEQSKSRSSSKPKRSSALSFGLENVSSSKTKKLPTLSERMKTGSRFTAALQEHTISSSVDPDGDLDFDSAFQDDTSRPFYNSDDEAEDTDDSETEWRSAMNNNRNNINMYSTSVPITVPMWGRTAQKSFAEDDDDDGDGSLPRDGASMAASIKALAQSVHGDGTEMFGELPRPRLNHPNFGKQ